MHPAISATLENCSTIAHFLFNRSLNVKIILHSNSKNTTTRHRRRRSRHRIRSWRSTRRMQQRRDQKRITINFIPLLPRNRIPLTLLIQQHPFLLGQIRPTIIHRITIHQLMLPTSNIKLRHIRHIILLIILKPNLNHPIHNLPPRLLILRLHPMPLQLLLQLPFLIPLRLLQRPSTIRTPTITLGKSPSPLPIPLIIKTQFLPLLNIPQGKYRRPTNPPYLPSMHDAIRLTRMINIPCNPPPMPGINIHIPIQCHNIQHPFGFVSCKQGIEVTSFNRHTDIFTNEITFIYRFGNH